ncbi:hypothetical protein HOY82DRAFT_539698 [Tuber indicum]|nr:hypothetical protein HOY82DRAFT_539698 [Tuber indicum]
MTSNQKNASRSPHASSSSSPREAHQGPFLPYQEMPYPAVPPVSSSTDLDLSPTPVPPSQRSWNITRKLSPISWGPKRHPGSAGDLDYKQCETTSPSLDYIIDTDEIFKAHQFKTQLQTNKSQYRLLAHTHGSENNEPGGCGAAIGRMVGGEITEVKVGLPILEYSTVVRHGVRYSYSAVLVQDNSTAAMPPATRNKVLIISKTVCDNQITLDRKFGRGLLDTGERRHYSAQLSLHHPS